VLEPPAVIDCSDADATTQSSGKSSEQEEVLSQFKVQCLLNIVPNTGFDDKKIGLLLHTKVVFD